ncbi:MAG: PIG-L deacetylase family protein [Armatimonadota bacterium]
MQFHKPGAEIFVPDGAPEEEALARTTHMGVGAHQDDLEIMAWHGILECFGEDDKWFLGVTATNGSGSPRDDLYADYTDEMMMEVRRQEQKKAAYVGEYGAQVLLDYSSSEVRTEMQDEARADMRAIVEAAKPEFVYLHNLADKHDTHIGSALRMIEVLREIPDDMKPREVYGCEVWRDLDWMLDEDKVAFDVQGHENMAAALLGVFDSQDCGGKRYDLASLGRRRANATYYATHDVDVTDAMIFAMDLTPLIEDPERDIAGFVGEHIDRMKADVTDRITKFS